MNSANSSFAHANPVKFLSNDHVVVHLNLQEIIKINLAARTNYKKAGHACPMNACFPDENSISCRCRCF